MKKIRYESTTEFNNDLKKLTKKYKSLSQDIEVLKKNAIELCHIKRINNNSIFPIPGFCNETLISCKVKKFASKSFKGKGSKTGLRLIYIYLPLEHRIIFVELYYKGVKDNEDRSRLSLLFNSLTRK